MKINFLVFKDEDTKGCHHIPELALGHNSVSLSSVPRLHPSSLCHLLSARLPMRAGKEFRDRHHIG